VSPAYRDAAARMAREAAVAPGARGAAEVLERLLAT
jgi:UDP:flavonoid glycosyltransferase YjiC (YdhE family)